MIHQLSYEEREVFRDFRVIEDGSFQHRLSIRLDDLKIPCIAQEYLYALKEELKASRMNAVTSLLSKRISYLVVVPLLYAFSNWNKKLDLSFIDFSLHHNMKNGTWLPSINYNSMDGVEVSGAGRDQIRREVFQYIFKDTLSEIWTAFCTVGQVSLDVLWENTAVYVFWIYEKLLNECNDAHVKKQIEEDFLYILNPENGDLFSDRSKNPLAPFYETTSENDIRMRKTCCFYFLLSKEGTCCKTCPQNCRS